MAVSLKDLLWQFFYDNTKKLFTGLRTQWEQEGKTRGSPKLLKPVYAKPFPMAGNPNWIEWTWNHRKCLSGVPGNTAHFSQCSLSLKTTAWPVDCICNHITEGSLSSVKGCSSDWIKAPLNAIGFRSVGPRPGAQNKNDPLLDWSSFGKQNNYRKQHCRILHKHSADAEMIFCASCTMRFTSFRAHHNHYNHDEHDKKSKISCYFQVAEVA